MKDNSYLIIGSKGFIGNHLKNYLEKKGYEVFGADVIVDYVESEDYFLIDASNADFHSIFQNRDFTYCINCSGAASVPDSLKNPLRDYHLNTVNVYKILDAIKNYQPGCKFVNLSSAAVYGNPIKLPVTEDNPTTPVSPYGVHKLMSEQICQEFYQFFKVPTSSLRIFSAYGEGLKKQLFWDLYKKTQKNEPVKLFGTGNESRDFIYIMDLVQAIEKICDNAPFKADILNIGNGEEIRISEAVGMFYSLFENKIDYSFSGEARKGDPVNWVADINLLTSLGYSQQYNLKDGLQKFYQWLKKEE